MLAAETLRLSTSKAKLSTKIPVVSTTDVTTDNAAESIAKFEEAIKGECSEEGLPHHIYSTSNDFQ